MTAIDEISLELSEGNDLGRSSDGSSSNESQVEFADVIEKLTFAIENIRALKPWKDRALKAERNVRQQNGTIARLKNELNDTSYELQKWKKRALRAEKENQDEVMKWKKQAIQARSETDVREEIDDIDLLIVQQGSNTYTNLVSERDDDESTISTFREDSKSVQEMTGKSFRDKWNNLGFNDLKSNPPEIIHEQDENSTVAAQELIQTYERNLFGTPAPDESSTVAAEEIMQNFERGKFGSNKSQQDDNSTVAAEEILNNYLNMKGRFNSRRFDRSNTNKIRVSPSKLSSTAVVEQEI